MAPTNLPNPRGLVAISPGPLLGSTLALVLLWTMRHRQQRRLSWTSTPLPPRGHQLLPNASTSSIPVRVRMTAEQPIEGSSGFYEWVFATTTKFHGKPWLLQRAGRTDVLVVSSPEAFEDIQRTFAAQFEKIERETHDVHGGAIPIVSTGQLRPSVNLQRQLAVSVLNSPALRQQASMLVKQHLTSLLRALDDIERLGTSGKELDVEKLLRQFALQVFADLGFGIQLDALQSPMYEPSELENAIDDVQRRVIERSQQPAVWKLERLFNVGSEAALSRSVSLMNTIMLKAVKAKRKHRKDNANRVDIFDLLERKCSSKSSQNPDFLSEFVLSLVVAARDSMTHTLTACLQCLALHTEEQDLLLQELKEAKKVGKDDQSIARLEAVIKETLRLHPLKPLVRRRARQDTVLSDGTFVTEGTEVAMDLFSMARHENVWGPDSAQFRPQRWIEPTTAKLRPVSNYKFNAFLGGPRACLGGDIALTELKTVIAAVLNKFHIFVTRDVLHIQIRRRDPDKSSWF